MKENDTVSCIKCLYTSNHAFGIAFNEYGLCTGCQIHEEKNSLQWAERKNDVLRLIKNYKSKKNNHDCIIHVDSSAESYYTVHLVKNILGLEPLLVSYNSHFYNDIGITNLANLKTVFNCDFIQYSLNLIQYKKIVKQSLLKFKHILWPYIAGKTSFPVRLAVEKKIPLIIWGGLQTIEQVGMFSHLDNIQMSRWHRKEHELFGIDENNFIDTGDLINSNDLHSFRYPDDSDIFNNGILGIYLSNYFKWDPWKQNKEMLKFNFKPENHLRSFDPYEYSGCSVFMNIHDISKVIRRGYPKVVDQLSREIRFKRISKSYAEKAYKYYSRIPEKSIQRFFDFLGMEKSSTHWIKKFFFNYNKSRSSVNIKQSSNLKSNFRKIPKKFFMSYGKGIFL